MWLVILTEYKIYSHGNLVLNNRISIAQKTETCGSSVLEKHFFVPFEVVRKVIDVFSALRIFSLQNIEFVSFELFIPCKKSKSVFVALAVICKNN